MISPHSTQSAEVHNFFHRHFLIFLPWQSRAEQYWYGRPSTSQKVEFKKCGVDCFI